MLTFWLAEVMTRPLGASTGDLPSQKGNQRPDLGSSATSWLFFVVIVCFVVFLQIRKPDLTPVELANAVPVNHSHLPHRQLLHPQLPCRPTQAATRWSDEA